MLKIIIQRSKKIKNIYKGNSHMLKISFRDTKKWNIRNYKTHLMHAKHSAENVIQRMKTHCCVIQRQFRAQMKGNGTNMSMMEEKLIGSFGEKWQKINPK